jgi:cell fate (sporulation/competence/biofilm development) regulator YmcA (YheA/YmcA/DUF963 family)
METQFIFNIAVSVAGFLGGWILSHIYRAIERLDSDIRSMPARYVRRDDYRDDMADVKSLLSKISDKLDHKVDKP